MTESFLAAVREFMLAQAQECFWQQAVMRELARTRIKRGVFFQLTARRGIVQRSHSRKVVDEGELSFLPKGLENSWTHQIGIGVL
jgi:hypothetical protein